MTQYHGTIAGLQADEFFLTGYAGELTSSIDYVTEGERKQSNGQLSSHY